MPKISVIVPIYNVEIYLRMCLDSLVNQTLGDIEIICINDGSPDNSLTILYEYAKKDERVKIINFEKNKGVSVARNNGLKIAKGEYIAFCDPDDYVDLNFYEKLYELAKDKNADIAKALRKKLDVGSNIEIVEDTNEEIFRHKCYFYSCFQTAIYRNKMLKKYRVTFPIGKSTAQDTCFLIHAVIVAKNIHCLDNVFYHYVRRNNSSNSKILSFKKACSVLNCHCLILNRLSSVAEHDRHYFEIYKRFFYNVFHLLFRNSDTDFFKRIVVITIKYFHKCKFPEKMEFRKILGESIVDALKEKDKRELFSLLLEWKNNDGYPRINLKESVLKNRKLYVWGTGADGSRVQTQCERNNWIISAFLDSNKNTKEFNGYKVKQPKQILNKTMRDYFIIISSRKYGNEISKICREAGLKSGKDFYLKLS